MLAGRHEATRFRDSMRLPPLSTHRLTLDVRPALAVAAAALFAACTATAALAQTPAPSARGMAVTNAPRTGDFDQMLERRLVRVAVPVSRTLYFNDKGRERGITADTALRLGHWFGNSPQFWMNLQQNYELRLAENEVGAEIAALPRRAGRTASRQSRS